MALEVKTFNFPTFMGVNSYLVSDSETGEAALIDCGRGYKKITEYAAEHGLKIGKILLTHGHFDHIMEVGKWKGSAAVYIHENDHEMMLRGGAPDGFFLGSHTVSASADVLLKGGEKIKVGDLSFEVIHTPGHSPGSVSYLTDGAIFTGDTLFKGSFGRYDFPLGSKSELSESLKKLFALPGAENITVYPGHDESTELKYESLYNPGNYCLDD